MPQCLHFQTRADSKPLLYTITYIYIRRFGKIIWMLLSCLITQVCKVLLLNCKFLFTDHQNLQAQIFEINFRMQNGMHQRVNVNAHKVVRINVKTWHGRISVKKNYSWLFNSSFWRERVVLNDEIWEKNQKNFLRPVHNLKSSEKPHSSST